MGKHRNGFAHITASSHGGRKKPFHEGPLQKGLIVSCPGCYKINLVNAFPNKQTKSIAPYLGPP